MRNRLFRDEQHKAIGGVCAGLAEYFNVDISLVRGLFLLALICKGGGLLIYFILWVIVPRKPYVAPTIDYLNNPQPDSQALVPVKNSPSSFSLICGVVLILLGTFFLLDEYNVIPNFDFNTVWPTILIVVGLFLMFGFWQRNHGNQPPTALGNSKAVDDSAAADSSQTA